jgi:glycosyltransferase involved in cell wall biosynthesis
MLENFDVTIVIPTFNNVEFLEETINSVVLSGLNYKIEILVGIDGCEKTKEFVKTISFPHYVKFQYFTENGGPYTIKNTLVQIANSDKIIFFDSDDLMSEILIPKIVKVLDNYEITKFKYINFTNQNNILSKSKKLTAYAEGVFGVKKCQMNTTNYMNITKIIKKY